MTDPEAVVPTRPVLDEPPPVLKTWARVYTAVMIYLACLLAVLTAITVAFRY